MTLQPPLKRVLGVGSAKGGVHHWWIQRVTSVALVPLSIWFVVALLALPDLGYDAVTAWMRGSWNAVLLILFVLTAVHHSQLGVQVVIEDYLQGKGRKTAALLASTFAHGIIAAACVFAILRVAFRSFG